MSVTRRKGLDMSLRLLGHVILVSAIIGWSADRQPAHAQQGDPEQAARDCRWTGNDIDLFAGCWSRQMMSDQQRRVANCLSESGSLGSFAFCAAARPLTQEEQRIAECALNSRGDFGVTLSCTGLQSLTAEQQRLARCIINSGANVAAAAICAGGNNLTPNQTVVAECAVKSGGQPYTFAGCVGGQLTTTELQKCLTDGIGGQHGCFGENNTIVQSVRSAWEGASLGPNSAPNGQQQIFGGPNSVFNNPSQLLGGSRAVFQASPPPVNLGTIGGHRVCLPWC
jgi:hypothetical protein